MIESKRRMWRHLPQLDGELYSIQRYIEQNKARKARNASDSCEQREERSSEREEQR
jgi:hypothetical protein